MGWTPSPSQRERGGGITNHHVTPAYYTVTPIVTPPRCLHLAQHQSCLAPTTTPFTQRGSYSHIAQLLMSVVCTVSYVPHTHAPYRTPPGAPYTPVVTRGTVFSECNVGWVVLVVIFGFSFHSPTARHTC